MMLHRITGKCGKCGNEFTSLKVERGLCPEIRPQLVCANGCTSYDKTVQVIDSITYGIEHDKYVVTDETKEALARMITAVELQERRRNS